MDDVFNTARKNGCKICGEKTEARVEIRLTELDERGQTFKGARMKSITRSLCGVHASGVYHVVHGALEDAIDVGKVENG